MGVVTVSFFDGCFVVVVFFGVMEVSFFSCGLSSFTGGSTLGIGVFLRAAVGTPSVGAIGGLLSFCETGEGLTGDVVELHWVDFGPWVRVTLGRPPF